MMIDEMTAIKIFGEENYYDCFSLFQEIFERKCDYKIIMTRRCFSLFKVFSPILKQKGITNQYGKIITDKAICFYLNEIRESLEQAVFNNETSTIIVDDIIIYGRTINSIIDRILNSFQDEELKKHLMEHMLVRCIMKNRFNSQIKRNYSKMILSQSLGSKSAWKNLSCDFSKLIKSANIANTSYVISYKSNFKDEIEREIFLKWCDKNAINRTTEELDCLNVDSYVLEVSVNGYNDLMTEFVECSWLRIRFYRTLNSIVISPLVILSELNVEQIDKLGQKLSEQLGLNSNSEFKKLLLTKKEEYFSAKIRTLILLLSHNLLCAFLNLQNSLACTFDNFDYEEILHYNFKEDLVQEFEQIHETYYMLKCIGCTFKESVISEFVNEEDIEEFMFRRAMMDNQNAISETSNRLDGVSEIEGKSIFMPSIMPTILTFIDNGKAALRSFFDDSTCKYVSKVFPGEQAFRIMEDKFKKYLLYLHHIERYSKIHNKNSYDLYREFTFYMFENGLIVENSTKSLLNYIKILEDTNQQISDVYVYDVMCKDKSLDVLYNNFMKGK